MTEISAGFHIAYNVVNRRKCVGNLCLYKVRFKCCYYGIRNKINCYYIFGYESGCFLFVFKPYMFIKALFMLKRRITIEISFVIYVYVSLRLATRLYEALRNLATQTKSNVLFNIHMFAILLKQIHCYN